MSDVDPQSFGRVQAEVAGLQASEKRMQDTLDRIQARLDEIHEQLAEARGGWKTLLLVGGAAGALGSGITKAVMWLAQVGPK